MNLRWIWNRWAFALIALGVTVYVGLKLPRAAPPALQIEVPKQPGMQWIPGGTFTMGNAFRGHRDSATAHQVTLKGFHLDVHEVTNEQFSEFVRATNYVTTAELLGYGYVVVFETYTWEQVPGANWRHPLGPNSTSAVSPRHPVVQVSYDDALAYCAWADKRLPTEAEWEYAARGGLRDADYPWGKNERKGVAFLSNYWQGDFPREDLGSDGYRGLAPVGQYPANGLGVYDLAGNVWEWCHDWYGADYYEVAPRHAPTGPRQGTQRCIRGGSWLCDVDSQSLTVWNRGKLGPQLMNFQTGFRCAK